MFKLLEQMTNRALDFRTSFLNHGGIISFKSFERKKEQGGRGDV